MKRNLILNSIVLFVTSFLLVLVVLAWYVSNSTVRATGIMAGTAGDEYTLKLQRGSYNSTNSTWTWTDTTSLSLSNIQPGDSFFFRVIITTSRDINLNMSFADIESKIDSSITVSNDYLYIGSAKKYNVSNNKVTVTENSTTKTLYNISGSDISLDSYKVEDTFKYYNYGICQTSPDTTTTGTSNVSVKYNGKVLDNDVTNDNITPDDLNSVESSFSVTASGSGDTVAFAYFALEFNDEASTVNYSYSLDSINKTCSDSNLYQAQILNIKKINVAEEK